MEVHNLSRPKRAILSAAQVASFDRFQRYSGEEAVLTCPYHGGNLVANPRGGLCPSLTCQYVLVDIPAIVLNCAFTAGLEVEREAHKSKRKFVSMHYG